MKIAMVQLSISDGMAWIDAMAYFDWKTHQINNIYCSESFTITGLRNFFNERGVTHLCEPTTEGFKVMRLEEAFKVWREDLNIME